MQKLGSRRLFTSRFTNHLNQKLTFLWVLSLTYLAGALPAYAGLFDLPAFIEPGRWSVGLEPELILSQGVGLGANLKPRYGISNFLNVQGVLGTGTGARTFRMGAIGDLEFFPDIENQPGLAAPVSVIYYRISDEDQITLSLTPMIYKTFRGDKALFTPFIGVPVGYNLRNKKFEDFMQVALGTIIHPHNWDYFSFTVEAGFNVSDTYSYISGGVTYYP